MTPIYKVLKNNNTTLKPIWIMRQAGRYLPEFREIRAKNPDFIKLCLNENLSAEITLQPLRRFDLDLDNILKLDEIDFVKKLTPVYKLVNLIKDNILTKNKNTIGFVGAPWTLLVYMINKKSPKSGLKSDFFKDEKLINKTLKIIEKFLKVHIKNQVDSGAQIIQIFDSWAGLLSEKDLPNYIYEPTINIVEYTKSLNVPVICFPKGIKKFKDFCEIVKPSAICIDYEVDPKEILKDIQIPVQGGMDPKILLTDQENLKKEVKKYLDIFKDHPYIFNLGHGILPETDPKMMDYLVKMVKDH